LSWGGFALGWFCLGVLPSGAWPDPADVAPDAKFDSKQISSHVVASKDVPPHSPANQAGCIKSIRLPKQAKVSRVSFRAQYQAFVRFAVGSGVALKAIALDWTCFLEPFSRSGLSL